MALPQPKELLTGRVCRNEKDAVRELAAREGERCSAIVRRLLRAALENDATAASPWMTLTQASVYAGFSNLDHRCCHRSGKRFEHRVARRLGNLGVLSKTAHRSIDSCQHNRCVECSHQKPQLRNPHACRLHYSSVEAAVVKTSKGARRWERSSGSIAEPAGICGPNQQKRRKTL